VQPVYAVTTSRYELFVIASDHLCGVAILMLLSGYTSEVTGATLDVNGGEYMPA
jgi:hypothetical protein